MSADDEARDQWGETAQERHNRILARDLAELAWAAESERDGVPVNGLKRLAFREGYAAGRADYVNASRPFTEEDVEAAARSLAETQKGPGRWDMWDEDFRALSGLRLDARAALDAATARHTKEGTP